MRPTPASTCTPDDDFGMAAANAVMGFENGAEQAQVSVNGIGERAGNAAYEEVVMAVESVYGVDTGIDTTQITKLARIVEEASDIPVPANKPVTGRNAFAHESGIHAAGVIENADTFETGVMTPEMVGAEREFVLGKHTGTHSVRKHLVGGGRLRPDGQRGPADHQARQGEYGSGKRQVTAGDVERFAEEADIDREEEEVRI